MSKKRPAAGSATLEDRVQAEVNRQVTEFLAVKNATDRLPEMDEDELADIFILGARTRGSSPFWQDWGEK